jgi:hypothetical protein
MPLFLLLIGQIKVKKRLKTIKNVLFNINEEFNSFAISITY